MFESKNSFAGLLAFFERNSRPEAIGSSSASSTMESQGARNAATDRSWGQRAEVNSLQRRLTEMTTRAMNAEKELITERKERFFYQFEHDEYEVRNERLRSMIDDAREVQKGLQTRNAFANKRVHDLEFENEELRAEINAMKANAFRAYHEADMIRLVAKQLGLQAKSLDRQLKESKRTVRALTELVEEREQVQLDRNTIRTSSPGLENQSPGVEREGFLHKRSTVMSTRGAANTSCKLDLDMGNNVNDEEDRNRGGGDGQAGLLRKLTLRFQRSADREDVHSTTELPSLGSRMFRKLRSIVRPGSDCTDELEDERNEDRGEGVVHKGPRVSGTQGVAVTSRKPDLSIPGRGCGEEGQDENTANHSPGLLRKLTLRYQRSRVEDGHATTEARWQVSLMLRKLRSFGRPGSGDTRGSEGEQVET
ncbi:hypothetical protein FGB62_79g030 [Gracilaria domingensis]|nr:hypothetical protein FGB62_79g030 [Gracilaria domingensis]